MKKLHLYMALLTEWNSTFFVWFIGNKEPLNGEKRVVPTVYMLSGHKVVMK